MERRREKIAAEVQDLKEELEREQAAERGGAPSALFEEGQGESQA